LRSIRLTEKHSHNAVSDGVLSWPVGYPTIGYGHVVLLHEQEQFAAGITSTEAT